MSQTGHQPSQGDEGGRKKKKESKQGEVRDSGCEEKYKYHCCNLGSWNFTPPNSPPPKKQKAVSAKPSTVISKVSTEAKNYLWQVRFVCDCIHIHHQRPRKSQGAEPNIDMKNSNLQVEGGVLEGWMTTTTTRWSRLLSALSPMNALAAAQRNKNASTYALGSQVPLNKEAEEASNGELPNGALDSGRWSAVFILTFLQYLGGMEKDIWAFKRRDTCTCYKQFGTQFTQEAVQRATERRNTVGSTGLSVVGDFMDSTDTHSEDHQGEVHWDEVKDDLSHERQANDETHDEEKE
ncbi:hypothetical protein EDB84DRAFT_1443361 [Lactarius hengduanensis]|nr:hypothetical protein EDB84DRAFT_1443361 [Lactarius hengduanensis]